MKTRNHLHPAAARRLAVAFCACIALASCGSDDKNPDPEPPGPDPTTIPLIINAEVYAATPSADGTRTDNTITPDAPAIRPQWTDGDWVAVEVNGVVKRYIATPSADNATTATLRPADADNTHYCPATECKLRAWRYGHTDKKTYIENFDWNHQPEKWWVLPDQRTTGESGSDYRKSDFLYAPEKTVSSSAAADGGNIGLTFYHQTARVVVNIRKDGLVTGENGESIHVFLTNGNANLPALGTFDAGRINPADGQYSGLTVDRTATAYYVYAKPILPANEGYAYSCEVLVMPQDISGETFISVGLNNAAGDFISSYTPTEGKANLQGGYTYIYDMTLLESGGNPQVIIYPPAAGWIDRSEESGSTAYDQEIDLSTQTTITDNRTYLLTGTNQDVRTPVYIGGGSPTIILKDADIKGQYPIRISGGTPTIKVEGKNQIISINGSAIGVEKTATVRIIGDGRDKSQLTAKALNSYAGDFPAIGNRLDCGDISLSGITLVAEGSGTRGDFSPAIGISGDLGFSLSERVDYRKCGSINITDCHVEAKAYGGAAAIGFGYYDGDDANSIHEMGEINIKNSTIKSTVEKGPNGLWPAHIGGSASGGVGKYTVGDIDITPPVGMNGTKFFENFNRSGNEEDAVVGYRNERNAEGELNSAYTTWKPENSVPWRSHYMTWIAVPEIP